MHLLGKEMRRRYIENKKLISSVPDSKEFNAFSIDDDAALVSAQAFMSGFFPSGLQGKLWDNQSQVAVPPFAVENLNNLQTQLNGFPLMNDIQSIPIHSNAGTPFSMLFNGYNHQ